MSSVDYPACVREFYESEIFGEAAALALVEVARNDRDRHHLGTLLQLETETKARLRPFLNKYGLSLSEEMALPDLDEMIRGYKDSSWAEFAAGLVPVVQTFLSRFEEIAAAGPAEDQEVLTSMIRHESASLKWVQAESGGESDDSLDETAKPSVELDD